MNETRPDFSPPRGMRDFYPEDMALRNRVFDAWRAAAEACGFAPYDACVVESLSLLERKAGEEIAQQIYTFTDKSARRLALRPELTPTLARMICARRGSLSFPLKWYAIAQCFRYERMTRGRKREHYQWNLDIVGENGVGAETEVLNTAAMALRAMGLPDAAWRIHVSNRALLTELLQAWNIAPEHHAAVFLALDKRDKQPRDVIETQLEQAGLRGGNAARILDLIRIETLEQAADCIGRASPAADTLRCLFDELDRYGLRDQVCFDLTVIRGLAYYTGIVFEAFDRNHESRAIFGGGRYDNLLNQIGGHAVSAVGLGFGDVVIADLLNATLPADPRPVRAGTRIGFMQDAQRPAGLALARQLRAAGERVDLDLSPRKPRDFFAQAGNSTAAAAILIGPDDVQRGMARRKNLDTREETVVPLP